MIERIEPQIIRMSCATVIHTPDSFFIYDRSAGDDMKSILCIASKNIPTSFIKEMEASKIMKQEQSFSQDNREYSSFSITVSPQFGYSNQKFEDILYRLFEKYNL